MKEGVGRFNKERLKINKMGFFLKILKFSSIFKNEKKKNFFLYCYRLVPTIKIQ